MRAKVPALSNLKGQQIEDVYIEHQPNGRSPILVIKATGKGPLRVSLVRRPPGEPIGMLVQANGYECLV